MFCSKCGTKVREGASFCKECGNRLTANPVAKGERAPQNGKIYASASWSKRVINYLIDTLTVLGLAFLVGVVLTIFDSSFANSEEYVFNVLGWLTMVLYYSFSEYWWGKTLGKVFTKTRVLMNESREMDFWTALKRTLIRFIPFEVFSMDGSKLTFWHDRWVNTRVVDETKMATKEEMMVEHAVKIPWGYRLLKKIAIVTLCIILAGAFLALLLGEVGISLFSFVMGLGGVLGFMWLLFGLPLGLIDLSRKNSNKNYNGEVNAAVLLGGVVVLGAIFSAYALVFILQALLGISLIVVN